jgi:sporulation protein YlmC with PRC-barrel domain
MRVRYGELVGRRVVDAEGARVGRVVDLVAAPADDRTLRVTALLVGYRALFERIVTGVLAGRRVHELEIPWSLVRSVESDVRLSVRRAELPDSRREAERSC